MKKAIKNVVFIIVIIGILGFSLALSVNTYMLSETQKDIVTAEEAVDFRADCILVLGAGVYSDGDPSLMLRDRLSRAFELYDLGASEKLLMSGDHGTEDYNEVKTMKQLALDHGIRSENVFMDHAGFSTYESMYRARDVFDAKKIIVVTQKYHLYRALHIAKALGLEAVGVAAEEIGYPGQTYRDVRELLARAKDFFKCLAQPEPTFLGETIPVSGNGDATNDCIFE